MKSSTHQTDRARRRLRRERQALRQAHAAGSRALTSKQRRHALDMQAQVADAVARTREMEDTEHVNALCAIGLRARMAAALRIVLCTPVRITDEG